MLSLILFIICLLASSVGSLVGAGGGVIIKPVLDMFSLMPAETVSFCSGCTVLAMSLVSLVCACRSGEAPDLRSSTPLALGAVAGGFVGKALLELVSRHGGSHILGGTQAICLTLITAGVLLYVSKKDSLRSLHVRHRAVSFAIGLVLGVISSFLGIGGGTSNVAVLFFFFSMDAKQAAHNSIYIIVFSQLASILTALLTHTVPDVSLTALLCMAAGGVGGALVGSAINKRISDHGVETALKTLLTVIVFIDFYNIFSFFFL